MQSVAWELGRRCENFEEQVDRIEEEQARYFTQQEEHVQRMERTEEEQERVLFSYVSSRREWRDLCLVEEGALRAAREELRAYENFGFADTVADTDEDLM